MSLLVKRTGSSRRELNPWTQKKKEKRAKETNLMSRLIMAIKDAISQRFFGLTSIGLR